MDKGKGWRKEWRKEGIDGMERWKDGKMESGFTVNSTVVHEHKIILKSHRVNMRSKE